MDDCRLKKERQIASCFSIVNRQSKIDNG